ncbi:GntR family transcriptional regulator [Lysobacter sp. 5GHs7-4]|uniref:GntR family transcriptional regulator n=1 Tax=Lysobacter sp. 5GHs7-4 TaxID=2904253 RepID=UPI001E2DD816|nr:GntR family transcriptional regulator [Lysobacter sp. 5GHs7-4]UHQ24902.1 GntR family transcriptional regulator [Lysobacter sp. 5GHs7-4]
MPVKYEKPLRGLSNTRDLRAEILALAAELATNTFPGRLVVHAPVISEATVRQEWARLLPVIVPDIRARMSLAIESAADVAEPRAGYRIESGLLPLERPNYRAEVLRLLLAAHLRGGAPVSAKALVEAIGASQTPVRQALAELKQAGVAHSRRGGFELNAELLSAELLAKMRATPHALRFRFARGAQIKPPGMLLQRALPLLGASSPSEWDRYALSGVAVARSEVPALDLLGTPRLDLLAYVPRAAKSFDFRPLWRLDDGLELEPNPLAPAPVVVALVRADSEHAHAAGPDGARRAAPADVLLSLLDAGLREQALQYAGAVRP